MYVENIGSAYMQNSSDLSQIEQIKRGSKSQKEQLKKVASEFESIFIAGLCASCGKNTKNSPYLIL